MLRNMLQRPEQLSCYLSCTSILFTLISKPIVLYFPRNLPTPLSTNLLFFCLTSPFVKKSDQAHQWSIFLVHTQSQFRPEPVAYTYRFGITLKLLMCLDKILHGPQSSIIVKSIPPDECLFQAWQTTHTEEQHPFWSLKKGSARALDWHVVKLGDTELIHYALPLPEWF